MKSKNSVKAAAGLVSAAILAGGLTSCASAPNKILREIDKKNFDEALNLYNQKDLSEKEKNELAEGLLKKQEIC